MLEKLYPREYLKSVYEITVEKLNKLNIDTVIFDIDNTLVPYWIKEPDSRLVAFFKTLQSHKIKLGVLSNSKEERSRIFCKSIGLPYVFKAKKPSVKGLHKIADMLNSEIGRVMLVGDQIFTDVLCANNAGAYSVLVKQVSKKDELITAPKRPLEKIVLWSYFRKEAIKNGK